MIVPMVRALRRTYPDARITWVISPLAYQLVEGMEDIEFICIDKPKTLQDYLRFKRQMKGRKFDVLLAAQASFRANLLYPFIRAKRKIGYDKARAKDGHRLFVHETITPGREHTLEGFLKFGEQVGAAKAPPEWRMPIEDAHYQAVKAKLGSSEKPMVVINPAASKPERSWPAENYIKIIQYLTAKYDVTIVLTGGPCAHDEDLAKAILAKTKAINLVGQTKPKELMALIDMAKLVLCPDTGPGHMASAMNTPAIALHAVTNPDVSSPYLSREHVIDAYPEALKKLCEKPVDAMRWGTQVHALWAMDLVPVDKVQAKISELLS